MLVPIAYASKSPLDAGANGSRRAKGLNFSLSPYPYLYFIYGAAMVQGRLSVCKNIQHWLKCPLDIVYVVISIINP